MDFRSVIGRLIYIYGGITEAAAHAGVHPNTLYNMERGNVVPNMKKFLAVCAALGEHPADVLREVIGEQVEEPTVNHRAYGHHVCPRCGTCASCG